MLILSSIFSPVLPALFRSLVSYSPHFFSCAFFSRQQALSQCRPFIKLHCSSLTVSLSTSHRPQASSAQTTSFSSCLNCLTCLADRNSKGSTPLARPPLASASPARISSSRSCWLRLRVANLLISIRFLEKREKCCQAVLSSRWSWCWEWALWRVKMVLRYLRERTAASDSTLSQRSMLGNDTSWCSTNSYSLESDEVMGLLARSFRYCSTSTMISFRVCLRLKLWLRSSTGMMCPPYLSFMSCTRYSTCRILRTVISTHSWQERSKLLMMNSCSRREFSPLSFSSKRSEGSCRRFQGCDYIAGRLYTQTTYFTHRISLFDSGQQVPLTYRVLQGECDFDLRGVKVSIDQDVVMVGAIIVVIRMHSGKQNSSRVLGISLENSNIEQAIELLIAHQLNSQKTGKYLQAEQAKQQLVKLRNELERQRRAEMVTRFEEEKTQVAAAHQEEMHQFQIYWEGKLAQYQTEADRIEEETLIRHHNEAQQFAAVVEQSIPLSRKECSEVIGLRKVEEQLARSEQYQQAHQVQRQIGEIEKRENQKWANLREQKVKNLMQQLESKQSVELAALRQKIGTGYEEQLRVRQIEGEKLLLKFSNFMKELENRHHQEITRLEKAQRMQSTVSRSQATSRALQSRNQ